MIHDLLDELRSDLKIPVFERSIENILVAVSKSSDFWEIVRYSSEPLIVVSKTVQKLVQYGYLKIVSDEIILTEKGRDYLKSMNIGAGMYTCKTCNGRTVTFDMLDIVKDFLKIVENRPSAIKEYDQGYVSPETTLARIAIMDQKGDLRGKNLLILGDDDLISIAAMLTRWPKRIVVFEIDERLVNFIKKIGEEIGYDVETYQHDLRYPLPDNVKKKFDTFFTDPPETLEGLKVFVGRGITALRREKSAGYFGFTLIDASLNKWRDFQKVLLNEFNVVITDIIKDFNEYVNWEYIEEMTGWEYAIVRKPPKTTWYTSSLYRIETLDGSKGYDEIAKEDIYYDEETASV